MARITELPEAGDSNGSETVPIVQGGMTRRAALAGVVGAVATTILDHAEAAKGYQAPLTGTVVRRVNKTLPEMPVNVMDFGAVGDGITDDTKAIRLAHLTGRAVWYPRPSAFYRIKTSGVPIRVTASLDGDQAMIKHDPGKGDGTARLFLVENYSGPKIIFGAGLIIDGSYVSGTSGEQDHLVIIRGSKNVVVYAVVQNAYGDCVYVGSFNNNAASKDIVIDTSRLTNPRRCNVAVVCGENVTIRVGYMQKSVDYVAAVDLEPNPNGFDYVRNVKIKVQQAKINGVFIAATANNGIPQTGIVVDCGKVAARYGIGFSTAALVKNAEIRAIDFVGWGTARGTLLLMGEVEGLYIGAGVVDRNICTNHAYNKWNITGAKDLYIDATIECAQLRSAMVLKNCSGVIYGPKFVCKDAKVPGAIASVGAIEFSNVSRMSWFGRVENAECNAIHVSAGGLFDSDFVSGSLESTAAACVRNDNAASTFRYGELMQFIGTVDNTAPSTRA